MAAGPKAWIQESNVLSLFPTFVWQLQWSTEHSERVNESILQSLDEINPGWSKLEPGQAWQSDHRLLQRSEYADLSAGVMHSCRTVLDFLKVDYKAVELTGCWVNVAAKGAAHSMHAHPNNFLSGVYYVQTWPGANTVNFHDPRSQAGVLRPAVTELTGQNTDQVVVRVKNGMLLIFPSYLLHSVSPSGSDELRVSVSFNVMFSRFTETMSAPMWEPPGQGVGF